MNTNMNQSANELPAYTERNGITYQLGVGWWIEAPNIYDPAQYPDFDCSIIVADYSEATHDQVSDVLEILYPTGHKAVEELMLQTLRGEISRPICRTKSRVSCTAVLSD